MTDQDKITEALRPPSKESTLVLPSEAMDDKTIYEPKDFILNGTILRVYINYKDDDTIEEVYVGQANGAFALPPDPRQIPVNTAFVIPATSVLNAFELYEEYGNMALDIAAQNQAEQLKEMIAAEQERQRTRIVTPGEMVPPPMGPRPVC